MVNGQLLIQPLYMSLQRAQRGGNLKDCEL